MSSREKRKDSVLWVLSEVYYPEETGTGYYISGIAEHLALKRPVSVLCSQPAYSRSGIIAPRCETYRGVKIFRCPCLVLSKGSIFARLIRMMTISVSIFIGALLRVRRGDSILAVTNPPSVPILAAILSFILRVPYSLVVHDVYPDIMAACGLTSRSSVVFKFMSRVNKSVLQRAESIFCIGRDMLEHLARARGTSTSDGIKVIPLWADSDQIQPTLREENPLLLDLGLMNKFVVLYAGNMGYPHDIETLAAAIKKLELDEEIHFIFIGSGPKQRLIDQLVTSGVKSVTVLPSRPRSEQNEFLNACDIAILSLVPGMLGLAVPSRTYNLMAAGKPIIALVAPSSEVARVVREEQIGWVIESGAVEKTVQALQSAKEHRGELLAMGVRARQAVLTKYQREIILSQFDAAVQERADFLKETEVLCRPEEIRVGARSE